MKTSEKIIYWLPRILMICFIIFFSLFSFDNFSEGKNLTEQLVGFFISLLPSLLLILLTILAWKKSLIGGIFIISVGVLFTIFFHAYEELISFLIISLPIFIIGGLFIANKK